MATIAVLGAGITGCCVALELARRDRDVLLIDQDEEPMNRASLRNEGKIHLGLVYANDTTFATARLQLRAALRFRSLLERWLGARVADIRLSNPFDYVVAHDSILPPKTLGDFYTRLDDAYRMEVEADASIDYLGTRPESLFRLRGPEEVHESFEDAAFQAAFQTAERAIDTDDLATVFRRAIRASPRIEFLGAHEIRGVSARRHGITVRGMSADAPFSADVSQVVNATWERRFPLDRSIGVPVPAGVLHRLKFRVVVALPPALRSCPSATMVIGRYGDVVVRSNDTAYLSWYPACLRGWSDGIEPPREWNAACRGEPEAGLADEVAHQTLTAMRRWIPALGAAEVLRVDAGAIVAYGRTDIDDVHSGLHGRTRVGVTSVGRYHSVDPGKLTTAPLFALEAADRVALADRAGVRA